MQSNHNDTNTTIGILITQVRQFFKERDWEKDHNPKDLAESICIEAAKLLQLFQWIEPEESEQLKNNSPKIRRIKEELADVIIYSLSMADTLNIDMTGAVLNKLAENRKKYPCDCYKGKAHLDS